MRGTMTRLVIALVELAGASVITYQQLPADQQQRIRLLTWRSSARVLQTIARRIGEYGLRAEQKYAEEVSTNG